MDRQSQQPSHSAKASQPERTESGLTSSSEQYGAEIGGAPFSSTMSQQRIIQMQRVMGNRSVAQMLSRHRTTAPQRSMQQPMSPGGQSVIQRWKDENSDDEIIDEILSALEGFSPKLEIDKTGKKMNISTIHNEKKNIEITIQPVSEAESGQPIFISHGGEPSTEGIKPYILYVVKAMDQSQLKPLLISAIGQIQDWSSETPGWFGSGEKDTPVKDGDEPTTDRSGVRKLEDRVVQSIETSISDTALWGTLVEWLPHLDEHENKDALSAQFTGQVMETAAALKLTASAATRFLTQVSEFYLRFHCPRSEREKPSMPFQLIEHLQKVTEKAKLSREQYLERQKERASNTDDDFEKAGRKRKTEEAPKVEPPKTEPSKTDSLPTATPDVVKGDDSPVSESEDGNFGWFGGGFGFGDDEEVEEVSVREEYKALFTSGKIKSEHYEALEAEITKNKDSRAKLFNQLNSFLGGKIEKEEIFLSAVKNINDKIYLQDLNTRFELGLTFPDNYTEKPAKKTELRDTLPTKQTIENAVDSFFISEAEAEFLVRTIGFHTAARMISYYRKNNAMAAIRGLIDQLKGGLGKVEASEDREELYSPLTDKSLILDTNIAKALLMNETDMNPEERQVKQSVTELLKGGSVEEIRLPNMVVGELVQFGANVFELGSKATPGIPWKPMPIDDKRDISSRKGQYASDLLTLEQQQVGGAKGAPDRQLVVDSLHALREDEAAETRLITADKGIIKHLYELYVKQVEESNKSWTGVGTAPQPVEAGKPFVLEMGGRKLMIVPVNATVDEEDKVTDFYTTDGVKAEPITEESELYKKIVAPTEGPAATLFGKPIGKEDSTVLVKDLIELISANAYDVAFVGGSVRDSVRGESPNDVDVTTNMDIDSLTAMLKKDGRFSKIPQNIVKTEKMHLLQLAVQTDFSVDITCAMRPQGEKAKSFEEDGFYEKDAKKRDFTMNALYIDKAGKLHDPTGRGVADALSKNLFSLVEGFMAELDDMLSYDQLGRLMKFSARDYHVADEQMEFVRKRMVDLIYKARSDGEMGAVKLSHILERARERTPVELIEVMKDLGFSDKLIRQLFPDSPSGFYEDGTPNYSHNVVPGRLDNPQTKDLPTDGLPDVKFDSETGRLYQYRMFVKDTDKENLIVDMDLTEHGMEGHTPPHYHLYRWIEGEHGGEWDKHRQGLSATGEPGRPAVEGGQYVGPRPWHWTEPLKDELPVTEWITLIQGEMEKDGIEMEIADKGSGLISFADEITLHTDKIRELKDKNKLSEFLMFVHKTSEKGKLPYAEDMSSLSLISSGGERLRFNKHRFEISTMLEEWGVEERPDQEAHWIRLFDLLYYKKSGSDSALLKSAAEWAEDKAGSDWPAFVERFEFYIAAAAKSTEKITDTEVDDMYGKLKVSFKAGEQLGSHDGHKLSLAKHQEEVIAQATSGKLGFLSESAAKYHYLKHGEELQTKTKASSYSFDQYLADAMTTIASGTVTGADYEQLGSQAFVFVKDENKAIVRVETDNTAYLASFYAISKKEREEETVRDYGESFEMSSSDGPGKGGGGDKSGTGEINRLFGSLEYFLYAAKSHSDKGSQDQALKQTKAARQVLDDIIIPMFYAKLEQFKPEYVEETIKRISSFREQMDFLGNVSEQLKEQQTIGALIEKMERDIALLGKAIKEAGETLKKAETSASVGTELSTDQPVTVPEKPEWVVELGKKLAAMESDLVKKQEELEKLKKFATEVVPTSDSDDSGGAPKGLANIGNSCYIGSIMQLMAMDDTYANLFLNLLPAETTPLAVRQLQLSGQPIITKLRAKQQVSGEEIAAFRRALLRNGWIGGNEARIASQQDASELFVFLTDRLRLDDKLEMTTTYDLEAGEEEVESTDSMLVLNSLEEGVDLNTLLERNMSGTVERFGQEQDVPLVRTFTTLPDVLTIQLARFQYSRELQRVVKIDVNVPVPQRKLTIDEEFTDEDEDVEYELESFILHLGASPVQGHYVGYFRRDDQWYGYNDSVVRPVSEEQVDAVSQKAYMLCFRKV